jgi:hypothetical protein
MKKCKYCNRIIVEDYNNWLEENPEAVYIQCPYCYEMERIK